MVTYIPCELISSSPKWNERANSIEWVGWWWDSDEKENFHFHHRLSLSLFTAYHARNREKKMEKLVNGLNWLNWMEWVEQLLLIHSPSFFFLLFVLFESLPSHPTKIFSLSLHVFIISSQLLPSSSSSFVVSTSCSFIIVERENVDGWIDVKVEVGDWRERDCWGSLFPSLIIALLLLPWTIFLSSFLVHPSGNLLANCVPSLQTENR